MEELELQIKLWHKDNEVSQKLEAIPGIGPITASAIVTTVGGCPGVQERQATGCMVWIGSKTILQRRQTIVAWH